MSVTGDISLIVGKIGFYGMPVVEQGFDVDLPAQPNITIVEGDTRLNQPATGYGLLYNRYALEDVRGLAPAGWRVAGLYDSEAVFENSVDYWRLHFGLYDSAESPTRAGVLKSPRTHPDNHPRWDEPNLSGYSGPPNNETGFTALPGGLRTPGGNFHYIGEAAAFWACYPEHVGAENMMVAFAFWNMMGAAFFEWRDTDFGQPGAWNAGLAIRLIKIDPDGWSPGDTVTDASGNVYQTTRITNDGPYFAYDEVWTTANLRTRHFANGDLIPQLQEKEAWAETEEPALCFYDNLQHPYVKVGKITTANAYIERLLTKQGKILIEQESEGLLLEQVLI